MSSVIYAFKKLQCVHLDFKDFNHLCFQKTTMSSFTFQRLLCLQSFTLSKDYNVIIYFSKTSIFSVIEASKRLQFLHLHLQDFNVFCPLYLQDSNIFYHLHFTRLQCFLSFTLYKTSTSSVFYRAQRTCLWLLRTQRPLCLCFKKNFKSLLLYRTSMSSILHFIRLQCPLVFFFSFTPLVFTSCLVE